MRPCSGARYVKTERWTTPSAPLHDGPVGAGEHRLRLVTDITHTLGETHRFQTATPQYNWAGTRGFRPPDELPSASTASTSFAGCSGSCDREDTPGAIILTVRQPKP